MRITNVSIDINEIDLLNTLNRFLMKKGIFLKSIEMNEGIHLRNISYKIFKNLNICLKVTRIINNKVYIKIGKLNLGRIYIPKYIIDIIVKFLPSNIIYENKKDKHSFIVNVDKIIENSTVYFNLNKILINNGVIRIDVRDIGINLKNRGFNSLNGGGVFLRLTQTTLRFSGEDIMSFVHDFVKAGNFIISGIDVSQAIYLKGIIVNSFEIGDVAINIKDLRENLIYIQIKIINSIIPGVNIEHIPIKIFVKDLLSMFSNLNLDLDLNSVRFIDDCIEVKINNFTLDMKSLSSGGGKAFLK